MKLVTLRRTVFSLSAAAVVALSAGWVPGSPTGAPVAEAAVLESGGPGGNHGGQQGASLRQSGGRQGSGQYLTSQNVHTNQVRVNSAAHYLTHVPYNFHIYHGPSFHYVYDWYFYRHISFPWLYQVYPFEPIGVCFAEYYFFEGAFYCPLG